MEKPDEKYLEPWDLAVDKIGLVYKQSGRIDKDLTSEEIDQVLSQTNLRVIHNSIVGSEELFLDAQKNVQRL